MKKQKKSQKTPLRGALVETSPLLSRVLNGLCAIENSHRDHFDASIRTAFTDSLDLDKALQQGNEQSHRWDYLLGHQSSGEIIGVEPHSARHDEITTVIKKRAAAREHLKDHLRNGAHVSKWLWVASGKVHFADTEKARLILDQNGVEFVGTKVSQKHMPKAVSKLPAAKGK